MMNVQQIIMAVTISVSTPSAALNANVKLVMNFTRMVKNVKVNQQRILIKSLD